MKQIFPKKVISQEIPIYSRQNSWLFTSLTKQLEVGQDCRDLALLVLQLTRAKISAGKVKGKGAHEPKAQTARAYPAFLSMKHA